MRGATPNAVRLWLCDAPQPPPPAGETQLTGELKDRYENSRSAPTDSPSTRKMSAPGASEKPATDPPLLLIDAPPMLSIDAGSRRLVSAPTAEGVAPRFTSLEMDRTPAVPKRGPSACARVELPRMAAATIAADKTALRIPPGGATHVPLGA